jgi:Protein of unknown function (DUF2490)
VPKFFQNHLLTCVICLLVSIAAAGQDNADIQSWNDVQVSVKLNKNVDLFSVATMQFQKNLTQVKDGRFAIGVTLKPSDKLSITPFTTLLRFRRSSGEFRTEYRFSLRAVYRFPAKRFGLSHRSQIEYRFRPGANSWRYRPSLTVEKAIPKSLVSGLKIFATEEPFYDSASGRFSRNRFSVGVNKVLSEKLSLDIYYLRQGDNFSNPGTVHVIGTAWKIKL